MSQNARARAVVVTASVMLAGALITGQELVTRTFEADRVDHAPAGFRFESMRQPTSGVWTVQRQTPRSFLVHRADAAAAGYALGVLDRPVTRDASVSVRMRLVGGDRTGGIVWRYDDPLNFYALILDVVRQDLSLFRVAAGNRVRLDVETGLELDPEAWHTLKVTSGDGDVDVWLGGIRVFDEQDRRDERDRTATARVGLVTSGRSEAWFEEIRVEPRRSRR